MKGRVAVIIGARRDGAHVKQPLAHCVMACRAREMKGRSASAIGCVDRQRARVPQPHGHLQMARATRDVQRATAGRVERRRGRPELSEGTRRVHVAVGACQMQQRVPFLIQDAHRRAARRQRAHDRRVPVQAREADRRHALRVAPLALRGGVAQSRLPEEPLDERQVAVQARLVQRRLARRVGRADGRAARDQPLGHVEVAEATSNAQRRVTLLVDERRERCVTLLDGDRRVGNALRVHTLHVLKAPLSARDEEGLLVLSLAVVRVLAATSIALVKALVLLVLLVLLATSPAPLTPLAVDVAVRILLIVVVVVVDATLALLHLPCPRDDRFAKNLQV